TRPSLPPRAGISADRPRGRGLAVLFGGGLFPICVLFFGGCLRAANAMAHLFQSGLFFGQSAWHGLSVTLPADSPARYSIDESIKIAGLDWRVESRPLFLGSGKEVEGHSGIIRC